MGQARLGWGDLSDPYTSLPPPTPSYDSNLNASRDDKKNKFASTMDFVEDYLNNVVSEAVPFANEEKNKLTFEVAGRGGGKGLALGGRALGLSCPQGCFEGSMT